MANVHYTPRNKDGSEKPVPKNMKGAKSLVNQTGSKHRKKGKANLTHKNYAGSKLVPEQEPVPVYEPLKPLTVDQALCKKETYIAPLKGGKPTYALRKEGRAHVRNLFRRCETEGKSLYWKDLFAIHILANAMADYAEDVDAPRFDEDGVETARYKARIRNEKLILNILGKLGIYGGDKPTRVVAPVSNPAVPAKQEVSAEMDILMKMIQ